MNQANILTNRTPILVLLLLCLTSLPVSYLFSQDQSQLPELQDKTKITFEDRLEYYLDRETQYFIEELTARELQLVNLISNVEEELLRRGTESIRQGEARLGEIYGPQNSLVNEYQQELQHLLSIYDDLEHLQRVANRADKVDQQMDVAEAKGDVALAMDDRQLYQRGTYTPGRVTTMVDEYTGELDSLLNVYDSLEHLSVKARAKNDLQSLESIETQKLNILKILSQWGTLGPLSEEDLIRYRIEMQRVKETLMEIKNQETAVLSSEANQLRQLKEELLGSVDETIFDLLTRAGYELPTYPTVEEFLEAWKTERLADIETRFTEYNVIWQQFIKTADEIRREDLMSMDLANAMLNYSQSRFRASELQFLQIEDSYSPYYPDLIPVYYYIAESKLHRNAHDAAKPYYNQVASTEQATPYKVEALVRLMQYEQALGTSADFFDNYAQVLQADSLATERLMSYAHYLAASKYFETTQYERTLERLALIPIDSDLHVAAQILKAATFTNLNDFEQAMPLYRSLADRENYPWSDVDVAPIRNMSRLRLGLMQYQRGQLQPAISTLNEVSPGFEHYDQVLIAKAWAYFRAENYDLALQNALDLLRNHIASDFTYEALVLAAHCDYKLGDTDNALNAYRYVVRARGVMNVRKMYDEDRVIALLQQKDLDRLERQAINKKQVDLYQNISELRNDLYRQTFPIQQPGEFGTLLMQDYYDEKVNVVDRLFELDDIIEWANAANRPDIIERAQSQRDRLLNLIEANQAEEAISNTAFLVDFPLAAKESSRGYRQNSWNSVFVDLSLEKSRIEKTLEQIEEYQDMPADRVTIGPRIDLDLLELEMKHLQDRLSEFHKILDENKADEQKSNIDYWTDYSGFGLTEIIFEERDKRLSKIDSLAHQLVIVEDLFATRRARIQEQINAYEQEIEELRDRLLDRRILIEQLERQHYFENDYFDEQESEIGTSGITRPETVQ